MEETSNSSNLVEATIAELAFLFVFAMFVSFAIAAEDNALTKDTLARLKASVTTAKCDCPIQLQTTKDGNAVLRTWCPENNGKKEGMFSVGEATLTERGKSCFDQICPLVILEAWRAPKTIGRVTIEGHASSDWEKKESSFSGVKCLSGPHCNQMLSSQRSVTVFSYCLASIGADGDLKPAYRLPDGEKQPTASELFEIYSRVFRNEGLGARKPMLKGGKVGGEKHWNTAEEDRIASRRVEFRILRKSN
ncbi:MAG: hypothetical protein MRY74_11135 [Neomegalonema sp.]|nr:hypothetical protein [Neomegalonema sp.]